MRNGVGSGLVAALLFLSVSFLTRISLVVFSLALHQVSWYEALGSLVPGLISDWVPAAYLFVGVGLMALLTPLPLYRLLKRLGVTRLLWVLLVGILLMLAVGEFLFWDEFGSRFNFIAVDYLLYTHEVMHNIFESYPMGWILSGLFVTSWLIVAWVQRKLRENDRYVNSRGKLTLILLASFLILMDYKDVYSRCSKWFDNRYANELTQNGVYHLFYAFRNNTLDYEQHYRSLPLDQAIAVVRKDLHLRAPLKEGDDPIGRRVHDSRSFAPYNVVVIMVESLSNHFLEQSSKGTVLTPYLRSLYPKSLYFAQHYATGTRTVRGLEAFSLAVPPTPGSSIVRRPANNDLHSVGAILNERGYVSTFAYGGIGYFDNMNTFFRGNGYEILDQTDIPKSKVHFSNAWGVADEILFDEVLERADTHASNHKPFFMHVMTTSNHRPYTFPSHEEVPLAQGNREAAVQYTDFAIGRFIEAAKKKPWFRNTIFVITADHCASSAGKSVIDVSKYHIPWIVYAPHLISPRRIEQRSSQLDMAPTLLGLLHTSYESHFFGQDKLKRHEDSLITLGTFQNLGFWKNDHLIVLSPKKKVDCFKLAEDSSWLVSQCQAEEVDQAVAWYELASERFKKGTMRRVDASQ